MIISSMEKKIIKKTLRGKVISTKMKDTAVVMVERYIKYPIYDKYHKVSKKYKVHDPGNTVKEGDTVMIESCRPISKTKSFIIKN